MKQEFGYHNPDFLFAEFAVEKNRMNKITYGNHQRSKIYSSVFFMWKMKIGTKNAGLFPNEKLETFGNKHFQKVPFRGKKL